MKLLWEENAWEDYCIWQRTDKKTAQKINSIIKDIQRNPFSGLGKPEQLKNNYSGWWSRRINNCDRIVYKEQTGCIIIASCKGYY